jgi:hypothetical protein
LNSLWSSFRSSRFFPIFMQAPFFSSR